VVDIYAITPQNFVILTKFFKENLFAASCCVMNTSGKIEKIEQIKTTQQMEK